MTTQQDHNLEKSLTQTGVDCVPPVGDNLTDIQYPPKECCDDGWPNLRRVPRQPPFDWKKPQSLYKLGLGQSGNCDPIMTGQILNDLDTPNRNVLYRYARGIRGCDEAMLDTFRQIMVLDEQSKAHIVPLTWASQEKAVDFILQENVRKDNSTVVDRIRLPIMALWNTGLTPDLTRFTYQKAYSLIPWTVEPNMCAPLDRPKCDPKLTAPTDAAKCSAGFTQQEKYPKDTFFGVTRGLPFNIGYTLYIWTLYEEDMNQILEQCLSKFSPVAYLNIKGVYWEVLVTLDSVANNVEIEPGDAKIRVFKYQIGMTAKTYIPQPIYRFKKGSPPCQKVESGVVTQPLMTDEEMKLAIEELRRNLADLEQSIIPQ